MSLLLKALTPKRSRFLTNRDALLSRSDERGDVIKEAEPASLEYQACDTAAELDPAKYIFGETAIIEPFEPFAETATEYLAADAIVDFDELAAERTAPELRDAVAQPANREDTATRENAPASAPSRAEDIVPSAMARLEELQQLILRDRQEAAANIQPALPPIAAPPQPKQFATLPKLSLREEYRELRDHLLTRFALNGPATLLVVDAGRVTHDASWLVPLAASIVQHFAETAGRATNVLIVEAAGSDCSVARAMGLQCTVGLAEALKEPAKLPAAITPTEHPQIQLLARGDRLPGSFDHQQLAKLWPALQRQFDLILVAAGSGESTVADGFLPLADGVILSVELDGTPRYVAEAVRRQLAARGTKLIGCVVHGDSA